MDNIIIQEKEEETKVDQLARWRHLMMCVARTKRVCLGFQSHVMQRNVIQTLGIGSNTLGWLKDKTVWELMSIFQFASHYKCQSWNARYLMLLTYKSKWLSEQQEGKGNTEIQK